MLKFKTNITWITRKSQEYYSAGNFEKLCTRYAKSYQSYTALAFCIFWEPCIDAFAAFIGCILANKIPCFYTISNHKLDPNYFAAQVQGLKKQQLELVASQKLSEQLAIPHLKPQPDQSGTNLKFSDRAKNPFFMQFSSGTTGIRKRVSYSAQQLYRHNIDYAKCLGISENDTIISWLPHYHDMGLIATLLLPLQLGIDLIYMSNFDWVARPQLFLTACKELKATYAWQPNFAFDFLSDRCEASDLSATRFISCAEPIFERSCKRFEEKFKAKVHGCYAMAENVFAVTQASTSTCDNIYRSSGKVFGTNQIKCIDDQIMIKSDHLFSGYDSNEQADITEGWYKTGDSGKLLDGELFVQGRSDDIFKIRGQKILPDLVEHTATRVNGVKPGRVACIALKNDLGEANSALVLFEGDCFEDDLLLKIRQFGIDKCVRVPDQWLVKSSSGKISRKNSAAKYIETLNGIKS